MGDVSPPVRPGFGRPSRSWRSSQILAERVVGDVEEPAVEVSAVAGEERDAEGGAAGAEDAQAPAAGQQDVGRSVAGQGVELRELVGVRVDDPAVNPGAVRGHRHRGQRSAGQAEHPDAPRAGDEQVVLAPSEPRCGPQVVVGRVQQPPSEARFVRRHHHRLQR